MVELIGENMLFDNNKNKGRAGIALAIAYYGANGYTVSLPLNDTQDYDIVIEKDNKFETVQCKVTGRDSKQVSLRTCGCDTKGSKVYKTVINTNVDYLFCVDKEQNLFHIPILELKKYGNVNALTLRTEPSKNRNKTYFPSEKYVVKI